MTHFHFGRAWIGHLVEDQCPCPQAACGLAVPGLTPAVTCFEHNPEDWRDSKTMRQIHTSDNCPANSA